jgi:hypothetical protein
MITKRMRTRLRRGRRPVQTRRRQWPRRLKQRMLPAITVVEAHCDHKFALFGCWGMDCNKGSAQALIAKEINEKDGVEFMVTAGDNFYVRSVADVNFETNVVKCYDKPMYASLGNHDIPFYDAELQFNHPRWIIPAKNYMINVSSSRGTPRLRILMINTNPVYAADDYKKYDNLPPQQKDADKEELEHFLANVPPSDLFTIIVGHHPLLFNRHKPKGDKKPINEFGQRIASMCNMYVCADEHNLQHIVQGDLNQFILGGGGAKPDQTILPDYPEETKFAHPYHGFGIFDVRKLKMTVKCMEQGTGKISTCYKYSF